MVTRIQENKPMSVNDLYDICKLMIDEDKGDYKVYLATGGYYDGYAYDNYEVGNETRELILTVPC